LSSLLLYQAFRTMHGGIILKHGKMDANLIADKAATQLPGAVKRDQVEADDNQREGPALPAAPIDHGDKSRKHERDPFGTEDPPAWGPDPFCERADPERVDQKP
jgi:hypothetical protein